MFDFNQVHILDIMPIPLTIIRTRTAFSKNTLCLCKQAILTCRTVKPIIEMPFPMIRICKPHI